MEAKKRLRDSLFINCPQYLNFLGPGEDYDEDLDKSNNKVEPENKLKFVVAIGSSPTVVECLERSGVSVIQWSPGLDLSGHVGGVWDIAMFCERGHPVVFSNLPPQVKINRFPTTQAVSRKDKLWENYKLMQKEFGRKHFSFMPLTFNLPADEKKLLRKMNQNKWTWIVKPPGESCGNGIRLVRRPEELVDSRLVIVKWLDPQHGADIKYPKQVLTVQKYITNPFLINGLKFDLRLYVLLTSIDPIRLYLYEDGLVRFATKPFSLKDEDIGDKFIHLTNYAINKESEEFIQNQEPSEYSGHKWSLKTFWKYIEERGHKPDQLWDKIQKMVIKTIILGHSDVSKHFNEHVKSDYQCFKLFGIDVILDENLKPWLLELNNYPSLCEPKLDRFVNDPMITEMFNIVGYQFPKMNQNKRKSWSLKENSVNMKHEDGEFCSAIYSREGSNKHQEKVDNFNNTTKEGVEIDEKSLTTRDIQMLIMTEEELSKTKCFTRLLPSCENKINNEDYLKQFLDNSYNDTLLKDWEDKYASDREEGYSLMGRLCSKGVHLQ